MRIVLAAFSLLLTLSASAVGINKVVVFGDSLSDNGNLYEFMKHQLPVSPPYFNGRFTNGPVWAEQLVSQEFNGDIKGHLLDYAYGGAGVSDDEDNMISLKKQVDTYLLSHHDHADDHTLFVVWIGANNYLAVPEDIDEAVKEVNDGIESQLKRLAEHGAKLLLVGNLPDLGHTPASRDFDDPSYMTQLSLRHNDELQHRVDGMMKSYPSTQWIYFDVFAEVNEMMDEPAVYGFTNVSDTCYESDSLKNTKKPILKLASSIKFNPAGNACDGYLFFDLVHPTTKAHAFMADKVAELMKELGVHWGE